MLWIELPKRGGGSLEFCEFFKRQNLENQPSHLGLSHWTISTAQCPQHPSRAATHFSAQCLLLGHEGPKFSDHLDACSWEQLFAHMQGAISGQRPCLEPGHSRRRWRWGPRGSLSLTGQGLRSTSANPVRGKQWCGAWHFGHYPLYPENTQKAFQGSFCE